MRTTSLDLQSEKRLFPSMKTARKYQEVVHTNVQNHLVYWMDFIWRSLFLVIIVYVFAQLWRVSYRSSELTSLEGYSLPEIVWYFMLAETIVLSHPNVHITIDSEIKQGSIAYSLTRPYNYIIYHYSVFLSEVLVRSAINFIIGYTVVWLLVGRSPVTLHSIPYIAVSYLLSSALAFCVSISIGLLAFWIEDTRSAFFIYQKMLFVLGGMLLPLEILPNFIQRIALYLPMRFIVHGVAKMFVKFDLTGWLHLTAAQILWLLVLTAVVTGLYRQGVKNLNVNGG